MIITALYPQTDLQQKTVQNRESTGNVFEELLNMLQAGLNITVAAAPKEKASEKEEKNILDSAAVNILSNTAGLGIQAEIPFINDTKQEDSKEKADSAGFVFEKIQLPQFVTVNPSESYAQQYFYMSDDINKSLEQTMKSVEALSVHSPPDTESALKPEIFSNQTEKSSIANQISSDDKGSVKADSEVADFNTSFNAAFEKLHDKETVEADIFPGTIRDYSSEKTEITFVRQAAANKDINRTTSSGKYSIKAVEIPDNKSSADVKAKESTKILGGALEITEPANTEITSSTDLIHNKPAAKPQNTVKLEDINVRATAKHSADTDKTEKTDTAFMQKPEISEVKRGEVKISDSNVKIPYEVVRDLKSLEHNAVSKAEMPENKADLQKEQPIYAQAADRITSSLKNSDMNFKIKLSPEGLGELTVDMSYNRGGSLTLNISSNVESTQSLLKEQIGMLKTALCESSLNITDFHLNVGGNSTQTYNPFGTDFSSSNLFDSSKHQQPWNRAQYRSDFISKTDETAILPQLLYAKSALNYRI